MAIKYFDTLEYVQKAKELRDPEALAEYQAHTMESAFEAVVQQIENQHEISHKGFTTKDDITIIKEDLVIIKKDLTLMATKEDLAREIHGVDKKFHGIDAKFHGIDAKFHGIDAKFHGIDVKIEKLRFDTLKFVVWTGVSVVISLTSLLGGLIAYGFHLLNHSIF